jgi:asparagine synthase (glutamine-hydrolysing)
LCGIAGIVDFSGASPSPQRLQRALHCLAPRGPDDRGTWVAPGGRPAVGLAHTRLAVIGPGGAGRQPLSDHEGRYHIVFNGTIYNYPQLKAELQQRGHRFATRTDTEVLLHGFMHWGEEVFPRLCGMWACAIYDA